MPWQKTYSAITSTLRNHQPKHFINYISMRDEQPQGHAPVTSLSYGQYRIYNCRERESVRDKRVYSFPPQSRFYGVHRRGGVVSIQLSGSKPRRGRSIMGTGTVRRVWFGTNRHTCRGASNGHAGRCRTALRLAVRCWWQTACVCASGCRTGNSPPSIPQKISCG